MKTKKSERAQLEHIKKPTKTTKEVGKKPKIYNTTKDTEAKFSGNAKKDGINLKRGKGK